MLVFLKKLLIRFFIVGFIVQIFYVSAQSLPINPLALKRLLPLNQAFELFKMRGYEIKEDKKFVFIVPSFNNARWYKKNLQSIFDQKYLNYRVIYVDDASTDNTASLVEEFIKQHAYENKVTLIKNTMRCGMMANRYKAIHMCEDSEIIIALDGDDWLPHDRILELYNLIYANPSIWITYGQFKQHPTGRIGPCRSLPSYIVKNNKIRIYPFVASHLKTFYAWLFKLIKIEDLKSNDQFLPLATDVAIMIPMLEMAAGHSKYIPTISCIYNVDNPLNGFKEKLKLQKECGRIIRHRDPYSPLINKPGSL